MKWYDVWFYCLLNVVLWDCLMLQFVGLARLYDVCSVLMLIPIHRFMSISGFVKDKRVSGHMRWGIAFGPRCKSLPSGMCRYLLSNILNLDPGNLNPSASIYIYKYVCVLFHGSQRWDTLAQPLMSGLVSMKPSKFHKPPDSTQPQGFSIDHGSFIIFLWFLYVTCFLISIETRLPETVSDGLRRSPALLQP